MAGRAMKIVTRFVIAFFLLVSVGQRASGQTGRPSDKALRDMGVIHRVAPRYPYAARLNRITGSGVFAMQIDGRGRVVRVRVVQSTGNRHLDLAGINALSQWRFKPGSAREVKCPVTWESDEPETGPASSWVFPRGGRNK